MWSPKLGLLLVLSGLWLMPDELVESQKIFEALPPDEQREMVRKWERFSSLTNVEQERWREFDARLAAHPDAEQLRAVMQQYYEWNLALTDRDRATLSIDSVDKRMELVQKIRLRQYEENLGADESTRLTLDELKILQQWAREIRLSRGVPPAEIDAKLDVLQSRFSGKAAELMEQRKGSPVDGRDGRWTLVWGWFGDLVRPTPTMLKAVYESLTDEERAALSELPEMTPDAINEKLREYYKVRMELPGLMPQDRGDGWERRRNRGPGALGGPDSRPRPGDRPGDRPRNGPPRTSPPDLDAEPAPAPPVKESRTRPALAE